MAHCHIAEHHESGMMLLQRDRVSAIAQRAPARLRGPVLWGLVVGAAQAAMLDTATVGPQ
jgi:hypothetical protein